MRPICRSFIRFAVAALVLSAPALPALADAAMQPTPAPSMASPTPAPTTASPAPPQAEPPNTPPVAPAGPPGGPPAGGGPPHGPPPEPPLTYVPSLTIIPTINFSTSGSHAAGTIPNDAGNPIVNGDLDLSFIASESLTKQLTFHYDHLYGGNFSGTAAAISAPALGLATFYPGSNRDLIEQYRLAYEHSGVGVELTDWYRRRICCPAASVDAPNSIHDHDLILTLGYTTKPISALGDFIFSYGLSAHHAPHHPGAAYLASLAGTGDTDSVRTLNGISQRFTIVAPQLARKDGLVFSETLLWGSLDYFDNAPYPSMYDILITNMSKRLSKNVSLIVYNSILTQRNQSNLFPNPPFAVGSKLHISDVNVGFNIHIP